MIMRSFSVLLSVPYAIFMPVIGRYNAAGRSAVGHLDLIIIPLLRVVQRNRFNKKPIRCHLRTQVQARIPDR
jgi:hypothetical protein